VELLGMRSMLLPSIDPGREIFKVLALE